MTSPFSVSETYVSAPVAPDPKSPLVVSISERPAVVNAQVPSLPSGLPLVSSTAPATVTS